MRPFPPRYFVLAGATNVRRLIAVVEAEWEARAKAGKPLEVAVTEWKAKRTSAQNRHYWRLLQQIADQAWIGKRQFSAESWGEYYKGKFIGQEDLPGGGRRPLSSTGLTVEEFSDFCHQVEADAAGEFGVQFD